MLRKGLLVAAVCVLLAPAALASGRKPLKDDRPVWMGDVRLPRHFAATVFTEIPTTPELAALTASRRPAEVDTAAWLIVNWYESSRQPFLDSLLPGTRFLTCHREAEGDYIWLRRVLRDGKEWTPENLNELLRLSGFPFDSAHMAVAAEAAVLLAHYGRKLDTLALRRSNAFNLRDRRAPRWMRGRSQTDSLAFPEMEILSMGLGTLGDTNVQFPQRGIWVLCRVEGVTESLFVGFWKWPGHPQIFPLAVSGPRNVVQGFGLLDPNKPLQGRGAVPPRDADRQPADIGSRPAKDTLLPPALRDSYPDAVCYPEVAIVAQASSEESALVTGRNPEFPPGTWVTDLPCFSTVWRVGRVPALEALVPDAVLYRQTVLGEVIFGVYRIRYRDMVFGVWDLDRLFRIAGVPLVDSTVVARTRLTLMLRVAQSNPRFWSHADLIGSVGAVGVPRFCFLTTSVNHAAAQRDVRVRDLDTFAHIPTSVTFDFLIGDKRRQRTVW